MAAQDRVLRALLRLEADRAAAQATIREVERVEEAVEELGQAADDSNLLQRIQKSLGRAQAGVGRGLGRLPGFDEFGKLTDQAKDRLEFLGDGFEQLIDTLDDLGVELDETVERGLRAAGSLARIYTDPIGAAVNAVGQAVGAWQTFTQKMEEGEQAVEDAWSELLDGSYSDAAELAREYNAAQERVNQAHAEGGIIADLAVDQAKLVNAEVDLFQRRLATTATDYADYRRAVTALNDNLGEGERVTLLLTQAQFENLRNLEAVRREYERGTASLADLAEAYRQNGDVAQAMGFAIQSVAQQVTTALGEVSEQAQVLPEAVDAYIDYQEQLRALQARYQTERREAQAEHLEELARAEERLGEARLAAREAYEERRQALMEQFVAQAEAAERAYYARRAQLAEQFGVQAARAEEDHQRRMRRMMEDGALRERDLIDARDALGLVRARRENERQRRQADEDFRVEQGRRSEDFGRQMAALEAQHAAEQEARRAAYEAQLGELEDGLREQEEAADAAYDKEVQRLERHLERRQRQIDARQRQERERTNAAFARQLQDLNANLLGEREMRRRYYDRMSADLHVWLEANTAAFRRYLPGARQPSSGGSGGGRRGGRRQTGGYVGAGLYQVGEGGREFVLSNPTTRAAERMAGGPLSQGGVLGAMGRVMHVSLAQTIHAGGISNPEQVAALVRRETLHVMDGVLRQIN